MERLYSYDEIVGRRIKSTKVVDDYLGLFFDDNTYLIILMDMEVSTCKLHEDDQLLLGLINVEEHKQIKTIEDQRRKETIEKYDREQFDRLKTKYGWS